MILARVAVAKSSRSAASSEDLSGTFYRACRKTAPRTGAVSSLSDLCSPHDAYAPCPLLAEQRLASHRLRYIGVKVILGSFRKGMDALAGLVAERLSENPYAGTIFVFRSKRSDRVKILAFDGTGLIAYNLGRNVG